MAWTRRSLLATSLLVAGCAVDQPEPEKPVPSPSAAPAEHATSRPPTTQVSTPSSTPSIATSPPPAALPTRDEIVAEFGQRTPTEFGMSVTGVTSSIDADAVALTFDACGGPHGAGVDTDLLALLRRLRVPATLFLNLRWVEANRALAQELAADELFQIESHGKRHLPLSMSGRDAYGIAGTKGPGEVYDELLATHAWFTEVTGRLPGWFRSGTAHLDDVAVAISARLRLKIAGFSVNGDAGATLSRHQVVTEVIRAQSGDIVIAHMNRPDGQTAEGFADALPRLIDAGARFAKLG